MPSSNLLVIGNGAISRAIRQQHPNTTYIGRPGFDLRDDPLLNEIPYTDAGTAVICAAIPNIRTCETYPEWTRSINVTATLRVAMHLAWKGYRSILLSSGAVKADNLTEYGYQKTTLENSWAQHDIGPILRLPKVLHGDLPLIQDWMNLLAINHPLHPFRTVKIQPISLLDTVDAIVSVAGQKRGIYEAAGQTVTWVTIARLLAIYTGSGSDIIAQYNGYEHPLLSKTKLEMLGWKSPPVDSVVRQVLSEWRMSRGEP